MENSKLNQETLFENAMTLSNKELKELCNELNINTNSVLEKHEYADLLVKKQIQEKTKKLFKTDECSICYESLGEKNNCTTPCGHVFCFECLMSCLNYKNTCPICRKVLQEEVDDEISEEFSEEEDGESDEEFDMDDTSANWGIHSTFLPGMHSQLPAIPLETMTNISTSNNYKATPRTITDKIKALGYTLEDIIVLWTWRVDRMNPKYNQRYLEKMRDELADLIYTLDSDQTASQYERENMGREDNNTLDLSYELQTLFENND